MALATPGIQKVMPMWKYLAQEVSPWSRTCPKFITVP